MLRPNELKAAKRFHRICGPRREHGGPGMGRGSCFGTPVAAELRPPALPPALTRKKWEALNKEGKCGACKQPFTEDNPNHGGGQCRSCWAHSH